MPMSKQERPHDAAVESTEPQTPVTKKPRPLYPTASVSMLKALANPIRQQLFHALTATGHARATDLAAALSMPANKVSFHPRCQLTLTSSRRRRNMRRQTCAVEADGGSWELGNREPGRGRCGWRRLNWVAADLHAMIQRLLPGARVPQDEPPKCTARWRCPTCG